ncbi:unnamed protein product [marine sediment metagenome]|uniref:Uncharacterized protein n=1 Tax=marine sediment metagenome TaxID=412755 RepID=X0V034_9ZZZZ
MKHEKIKDIIEKEIKGIRKTMFEHPERLSEYGIAYWKGNIAALEWVLTTIAAKEAAS